MKWPTDRKFTDRDGKILDHWRGPMSVLEPLLNLTPAQFAALQQMIAAFLDQDDEGADLGTAINLALPIDEEPLPSEDWFITYKNSAQAGRRVPMSRIPLISRISSNAVSGVSTIDIAIPLGFRDVEIRYSNLSMTSTATANIAFSEDGGATLLTQAFNIFTDTFDQSGSATATTLTVTTGISAATVFSGVTTLKDYASLVGKLTQDIGLYDSGGSPVAWTGARFLSASAAPVNTIRIATSAGTFDGGTVDLIGIP